MAIGPGEELAWRRLADALIARRIDLRYRVRRKFCDERELDERLTYDIEKARRTNYGRATLLDIARAYAVTPESVERCLRGGSLEPLPAPAVRAPEPAADRSARPVPPAVATAISALVASLTPAIEVEVRRARMRDATVTGAGIFTDPYEAAIWDLELPEPRKHGIVAFLRAVRTQRKDGDGNGDVVPDSPRRAQLTP
jgi:hypothetical protein